MAKRFLIAALVALLAPLAAGPRAEAAGPKAHRECVVHVTGQEASGELALGPVRCYATHAEAMAAEGVGHWGAGASERAGLTALSFTIGRHCDPYNLANPCFNVVGDSCIGGWIPLDGTSWDNKVSSTQNGCPTVRHFSGAGLTGSWKDTVGPGVHNLTTFDNITTSIQYL